MASVRLHGTNSMPMFRSRQPKLNQWPSFAFFRPNQWCSFKDRPPNGGGGVGDGWDVKKDGGRRVGRRELQGGLQLGRGVAVGEGDHR